MNKKIIMPIAIALLLSLAVFVSAVECTDTDEGLDYYTKGSASDDSGNYAEDSCEGNQLIEMICIEQGIEDKYYTCPNGCENGVCIKIEPSEETGPINLPEDISEEEVTPLCSGCFLEEKCYPFGYRKSGNFCLDENNQFVEQKEGSVVCKNSFECKSNSCIDGQCVEQGVWSKIFSWFKRLFGAD